MNRSCDRIIRAHGLFIVRMSMLKRNQGNYPPRIGPSVARTFFPPVYPKNSRVATRMALMTGWLLKPGPTQSVLLFMSSKVSATRGRKNEPSTA